MMRSENGSEKGRSLLRSGAFDGGGAERVSAGQLAGLGIDADDREDLEIPRE